MIQEDELLTIQQEIKDFDVVFDVGANCGDWGREVLNRKSNCKLFCFEPNERIYKKLVNNLCDLSKDFAAVNTALSSKEQTLNYFDYPNADELSTFHQRLEVEKLLRMQAPEIKQLNCTTLDKFCKENDITQVDFLKIDTEGHELDVLQGSEKMLSEGRVKCIQFEYGGTYLDAKITLAQVFNLLKKYRYKISKLGGSEIDNFTSNLEDYNYSNFLAKI